jgi:nitrite reductase/ring-hydroxylating ferredoxin subunit
MAVNHKGTVRDSVPSLVARLLTAHAMPLTLGAQVYALSPKCPHLGLPMKTGETSAGVPRAALCAAPCHPCHFFPRAV